jgi:hypothetical protein
MVGWTTPLSSSAEEQEFTALGWRLIEWKVAYYKPEYVHSSRFKDYDVTDEVYDAAEVRYLTLVRILREQRAADPFFADCPHPLVTNTIVHKKWPGFDDVGYEHAMMEVDMTRPSVQLVVSKLSSPKRKRKK